MAENSSSPTSIIRRTLQTYADRGVFRAFTQVGKRGRRTEFRFTWLTESPFHLWVDPVSGTLTFKNLLPNVPAKSPFYEELKTFVRGLSSTELPSHRRIDPKRMMARCTNRSETVSVTFKLLNKQYELGVKKALNHINEIFLSFLNLYHYDYMVENFDLPEE